MNPSTYIPQTANLYYDSSIDPSNLFAPNIYSLYSSPSPLSHPSQSHSRSASPIAQHASPFSGRYLTGSASSWNSSLNPPGSASSQSSFGSSAPSHTNIPPYQQLPPPLRAARRATATKSVSFKASTLDDLAESSYSDGKPDYSVKTLCEHAITGCKKGKMTLNEIVEACADRYPYFQDPQAKLRFRNSARHDLSQDPRFVKVKRTLLEPGRGTFWTYNPTAQTASVSTPPMPVTALRNVRDAKVQSSVQRRASAGQPTQAPTAMRRQSVASSPYTIAPSASQTYPFPQNYTLPPNAPTPQTPTLYSQLPQVVPAYPTGSSSHAVVRFQPYARRISNSQSVVVHNDPRLY
ncbi:hypothetical protein FRB96_002998 [Tulasnella sp. 330]|nr:hypothetical protein FRB96_002998 [Tulasnella sp. 330]KAG8874016.1 hypothetical protein FRB97_006197 [Tulasnella sp. 331]KAG8887062.1 hypothetical protein FRB98_000589 [Tulasnella sp. 332]